MQLMLSGRLAGSIEAANASAEPTGASFNMGTYSQRELHAENMEHDGSISFQYIENNGDSNNMMRCVS